MTPGPVSAEISVYDHDGDRRVLVEARVGDEVEYKRNGQRGTFRCQVTACGFGGRLRLTPLTSRAKSFWSAAGFCSLYRDGRRLP